jgi:protein O-mannosyl-transferase
MPRTSTATSDAATRALSNPWVTAAVLICAAFATYWNSLRVPFFFDDPITIVDNPTIRNLGNLGEVLSPPRNGSGVTGRPIVNLSLAINYALGGTSVTGYHVANILFHVLAGLALYGCARRTLLQPRLAARFGPVAQPLALLGAAMWLLHPLQTESVTCVIQRTEVLVGLFYLLTLYCFTRSIASASNRWAALSVLSCCVGMATKEVMVTAPVIVLLYDRTFFAGTFAGAWRARRKLYFGLAASWLVLAFLIVSVGGTRGEAAGFGVGVTWWSYALKQCEAVILYLRLLVWPHPLVVFYGTDVVTNPAQVWPQILLLIALVAAALYALWRKPVVGFCAMWFFLILAPSSSVVPLVSQTVSEHRMYLPSAAPLLLALATGYACFARRGLLAAVALVVAFGVISARRNTDYRNELAIWTDTVAKVPRNSRARVNLGAALGRAGHNDAALAEYNAALRDDPQSAEGHNNVATLLLEAGRPADAIEPCRAALRLKPKFSLAHNNLGIALVQTGKIAEGITHLQTALSLTPDLTEAHCNLSSAFLAAGDLNKAIEHGERAVQLNPNIPLAHFNLSQAFLQRNQPSRAIAELETAVRLKPAYAEAQCNLGSLYYQAGDAARAVRHYEAALRARPGFLDAQRNLASALFQTGRVEESIQHYRAVIQLQPADAETHFNLALVLARSGRVREAIPEYEEALRLRPTDDRAKGELLRLRAAAVQPVP